MFLRLFSLLFLFIAAQNAVARSTTLESVRYWSDATRSRLVFDLNKEAKGQQVFQLDKPNRLVIDLKNTRLATALEQPAKNHGLFRSVRSGIRNKKDLRVVVDLKHAVNSDSFTLKPNKKQGHRLVVDVLTAKPVIQAAKKVLAPVAKKNTKVAVKKTTKVNKKVVKSISQHGRDIIVAIDAGHGGKDPGARGPKGTQEKKVVFAIAKKLQALINKKPGMKAVMVRKGDYYIKLRKRIEIARAAKADLFVSIHADAFKSSKVKGASVFTLSNRGASSEAARWLAKNENAADLVGGVNLGDKEDDLAMVLMDLSQTATKEASKKVAKKVLRNFGAIGHLHQRHVQKAGFLVLKSPDIPSILVETAFISNPSEERKLKSAKHQNRMARAIYKGVLSYFEQYAPADTYIARNSNQKHVIARGETLSEIAQQYGVSMRSLKIVNALASTQIRVGQVLKIPRG